MSHTTNPDKLRLDQDAHVESEAAPGDADGQLPCSVNVPAGPERHTHRGPPRILCCACVTPTKKCNQKRTQKKMLSSLTPLQ